MLSATTAFRAAFATAFFRCPATRYPRDRIKSRPHRFFQPPRFVLSSVSAEGPQPAPSPPQPEGRNLRRGDNLNVKITRIAYGGACVGEILHPSNLSESDLRMPVYTPKGACPGDVVRCLVTKVRRRKRDPEALPLQSGKSIPPDAPTRTYAEAVFLELVRPSPVAVEAPCPHFGSRHLSGGGCGGCTSMQIKYEMQIEEKQRQLETLFSSFSDTRGFAAKVLPVVPCSETLHYRNKMEFSYGRRWLETTKDADATQNSGEHVYALGLHVPRRFDKVLHISECLLQPSVSNSILSFVREEAANMLLEPYDTRRKTGYLQNVAIRSARNKDGNLEVMVNVITGPCEVPGRLEPLAQKLKEKFTEVVCVLQNIRGAKSSVVVDETQERLLAGDRRYIEQKLGDLWFRISANSFFQTNPEQAKVLYEYVRRAANLCAEDEVLDLFCGTGTIGLYLARDAKHVYGFDVSRAAIEDARMNARVNGIENATFEHGNLDKMKKAKQSWGFKDGNVIIVDPPRAGLHPDLIKFLGRYSKGKRIVYVSCNAASQLRDVNELEAVAPGKFRVDWIQPIDMFPNTHHIECIVCLERTRK